MRNLEIIYYTDVSGLEDNIAHLLEHCVTEQLYERLKENNLDLFDCYSTTTPSNIILEISAYTSNTVDKITEIIDSLGPCTDEQIDDQIHRIELEDDLPLNTNNLQAVYRTINALITKLHFSVADTLDKIPSSSNTPQKPDNTLLVYGLGVQQFSLSVQMDTSNLDDNIKELTSHLIDCLAGRFLRNRNIYALSSEHKGDTWHYIFRVANGTSRTDLEKRWGTIYSDFINNHLDQLISLAKLADASSTDLIKQFNHLNASIEPLK